MSRLPVIRNSNDMKEIVEEYGFLPFFSSAIPGFSVEEMALAAWDAAEHLAALMRELGALAYTKAEKRTRTHRRQASTPLARPRRARRLAMQQNRPPGIVPG